MKKSVVAAMLSAAAFSIAVYGGNADLIKNDVPVTALAEDLLAESDETAEEGTAPEDTAAANETVTDAGNDADSEELSRSYLTGKLVDSEVAISRPVAVMLNNIKDACPQAGISYADVVYEAPVEGLLTRLMGIFEEYNLDKIGSVRSSRNYFIEFAQEFDAIYVHYGQSIYAVSVLNAPGIDNISGLGYQEGVGAVDGYVGESYNVFYRTSDRVAPHNCYTSYEGIQTAIDALGYNDEHYLGFSGKFQFAADEETVTLTSGTATKMSPGYPVNQPWFEYNAEEGVYYRYQYGAAQYDQLNEENLSYENVIFQVCDSSNYDDNGYLNIDTKSGGNAYYFTKGTYQKCTWSTENPDSYSSPAKYYDENGDEITLNQGKTWVCIIRSAAEADISIEE